MRRHRFIFAVLFSISFSLHNSAQINWQPHPLPLKENIQDRIEFGYLAVPENHDIQNSREIFIAFTVVKSSSPDPLPDPVIILPGGPGYGASGFVDRILEQTPVKNLLEKRDLILVDPRGCGYSHPKICENLSDEDYIRRLTFARGEERNRLITKAMQECAGLIAESNADLHAYNSIQVAHDVEELRKNLGYEQWNLRGHSYGSWYGFVLMQQYPESVKSAVLSGPVPPELFYDHHEQAIIRSLEELFAACKTDPDCNRNYPDIQTDLLKLLERLEKEPIPVPFMESESYTAVITPALIVNGLYALLYLKNGIEIIPAFIHAMVEGNDWIASNMAAYLVNEGMLSEDISQDMLTIIHSNDFEPDPENNTPAVDSPFLLAMKPDWLPRIAAERDYAWELIRQTYSRDSKLWKTLDIPVLLISGQMDPITPPHGGEAMMNWFSNSTHHVIPGSGHYPHADASLDYGRFYDNPDINIDIASISEVKPLDFVTEISLNRGISSSLATIAEKNYTRFIIPALAVLFSIFGFLFFPLRYLIRKIRKKTTKNMRREVVLIWLVTFTSLAISGTLSFAVLDAFSANPFMVSLGLSEKWDFIRIIAIGLIFVLILNVFTFRKLWKYPGLKIPSSISLAGGIIFCLFIWVSGMV